jgi:hypothetical protein
MTKHADLPNTIPGHTLVLNYCWFLHSILSVITHRLNISGHMFSYFGMWEIVLKCVPFSYTLYIVTWMARALLGNAPANTSRPNKHKATIEESPFLCNDL